MGSGVRGAGARQQLLHERGAASYERHRPETTALYELVRDNLETLYGAIADGALDVKVPKHAKKELEAYLDCGLLCRGFARLRRELPARGLRLGPRGGFNGRHVP